MACSGRQNLRLKSMFTIQTLKPSHAAALDSLIRTTLQNYPTVFETLRRQIKIGDDYHDFMTM